jgi:hypothetical protein
MCPRSAIEHVAFRDACHDVDDRKRAARRSGAVFLVAMPDDLRHAAGPARWDYVV